MENTNGYPLHVRSSGRSCSCKGECMKDFILPERYPDIRKILYAGASLSPGRTEVGAGKLTSDGEIIYNVIFSDDSGDLRGAEFRSEYRLSLPLEKGSADDIDYIYLPEVESVSAKAVNPRKIGLRAVINLRESLWRVIDPSPVMPANFSAEDKLAVERRVKQIKFAGCSEYTQSGVEISEDIELERASLPIERIDSARASFDISESAVSSGKIDLRGMMNVDILYTDSQGEPRSFHTEMPFAQSVDAGGADDGAECVSKVYVDKLSALAADNAFGEQKRIELDLTCSICSVCMSEKSSGITDDAFGTVSATENVMSELSWSVPRDPLSAKVSRTVEGECRDGESPVCAFADCRREMTESGGEGVASLITVIMKDPEGGYSALKLEDRFPLNAGEGSDRLTECFAGQLSVSVERGRVRASYICRASGICKGEERASAVREIALSQDQSPVKRPALTVCYLSPDESVWDAAKRYRISLGALAAVNRIEEGKNRPDILLIPGKK